MTVISVIMLISALLITSVLTDINETLKKIKDKL